MVRQLLDRETFHRRFLEPAYGGGALVTAAKHSGYDPVFSEDPDYDFLEEKGMWPDIITNPPFSLFDEFVAKAREVCSHRFAFLAPVTYLSGKMRYDIRTFNELQAVYIFTRQALLKPSVRDDGNYEAGSVVYCWMIWHRGYWGSPKISWIDNDKHIFRKGRKGKKQ